LAKDMKGRSKKSGIVLKIFLPIIAIFVTLMAIEICAQLINLARGSKFRKENISKFYEYDPLLGWKNKPGVAGKFAMPDFVSEVKINSKGLRDREYPYERNNKPRIAVLGDSFTWGYGVNEPDTFCKVLEHEYFHDNVEVLIAGIPGYGTDQQLLFYEKEIHKYKPDIVILAIDTSKIYDVNYRSEAYGYPKPRFIITKDGLLELTNVPVPRKFENRGADILLKEYLNYYLTYSEVLRFLKDRLSSISYLTNSFIKYKVRSGKIDLNLTKRLIMRLKRDVEADGAKFIIVMIPSLGDLNRGESNFLFQEMFAFFREQKIISILPFDNFLKAAKNQNRYIKGDIHFNEHGHHLMASSIYQYFKANNLLSQPSY